jgi:hypothetical protein
MYRVMDSLLTLEIGCVRESRSFRVTRTLCTDTWDQVCLHRWLQLVRYRFRNVTVITTCRSDVTRKRLSFTVASTSDNPSIPPPPQYEHTYMDLRGDHRLRHCTLPYLVSNAPKTWYIGDTYVHVCLCWTALDYCWCGWDISVIIDHILDCHLLVLRCNKLHTYIPRIHGKTIT